jgi:hypothetical protein
MRDFLRRLLTTEHKVAEVKPSDIAHAPSGVAPLSSPSPNNLPTGASPNSASPSSVTLGGQSFTEGNVKMEDVRDVVDEAKKDFITIFGVFAALLIFLSIEIQVFQQAKRFSYIMGVSFFLLSAILMFALAIHSMFNSDKRYGYYLLLLGLIVMLFLASAACFLWGVEHTLAFWKLFKKN